jgi:hypothetical protein
VPLNLEMKLEVRDSPNSAGVVIDAVRCAKLGLDHGLKGALIAPSSYFKKSPPVQIPDDRARELTEAYIRDPKGVERMLREKGAPSVKREKAPEVAGRERRSKPMLPSENGHATAVAATAAPKRTATRKRRKPAARVR